MWKIVIEKVNRKRKKLSSWTWRWANYFWYCLWNGPWTRTIQRIWKNSTIPVSITHHWNLIPSHIAKIREKLHSFIHLLIHISFFLFRFKLHSFTHVLIQISFFHSFGSFRWWRGCVSGRASCVRLPPLVRRCVCVCTRENYVGLRSGERRPVAFCFNAKPRISSRSKSRYRQNLSHLENLLFLFILSDFRRNPTARWG